MTKVTIWERGVPREIDVTDVGTIKTETRLPINKDHVLYGCTCVVELFVSDIIAHYIDPNHLVTLLVIYGVFVGLTWLFFYDRGNYGN